MKGKITKLFKLLLRTFNMQFKKIVKKWIINYSGNLELLKKELFKKKEIKKKNNEPVAKHVSTWVFKKKFIEKFNFNFLTKRNLKHYPFIARKYFLKNKYIKQFVLTKNKLENDIQLIYDGNSLLENTQIIQQKLEQTPLFLGNSYNIFFRKFIRFL